jgi:hypothetical protein
MVLMAAAMRDTGSKRRFAAASVVVLAALLLIGGAGDSRAAHSYPRLVNIYFPSLAEVDLELLSRWDLLVLSKRAEDVHQAELAELRALNPEATLIAHMAVGYSSDFTEPPINGDLTAALDGNGWWMRDTAGGRIGFGSEHGTENFLLNMTLDCPTNPQGQRLCEWLPEYIADRLYEGGRWDGLFLDYCLKRVAWMDPYLEYPIDHDLDGEPAAAEDLNESWRLGMRECVSRIRDLVGDEFLLVANGNNTLYDLLDGNTRESFPQMHGDWYDNMMNEEHGYLAYEALYRKPTTSIINTIWRGEVTPDGPVRYGDFDRQFLLGLTSTLVFGSGYFSCDGPIHSETWWIEYYDIDLGQPLGRAEMVDVPEGTVPPWVEFTKLRRFDNGVAMINPARWSVDIPLGGAYYDIHSWNGQFYEFSGMRTTVRLSSQTGEVLVGTGVVPEHKTDSANAVATRDAVVLTWDAIDGASSYSIYRAKVDSSGNPQGKMLVTVVDEPFYTDRDLVGASNYRYYIAPIDALKCEGRQSRAIVVSTEPGSDLSIALIIDELNGPPVLRWNPAVNSVPPFVIYELWRREEGGGRVRLSDEPLTSSMTGYSDASAEPGRSYVYEMVRRSGGVEETLASARTTSPAVAIDERTAFAGVWPQPITRRASVAFTLANDDARADARPTRLTIYDVAGRLVRRLVESPLPPGRHVRQWDLTNDAGAAVASGCYFFVLERGREHVTSKALVLR